MVSLRILRISNQRRGASSARCWVTSYLSIAPILICYEVGGKSLGGLPCGGVLSLCQGTTKPPQHSPHAGELKESQR